MSYKLAYSTLRWQNPELEPALNRLAEAGWQGWESRLPLNWMGTPANVCAAYATTPGCPSSS